MEYGMSVCGIGDRGVGILVTICVFTWGKYKSADAFVTQYDTPVNRTNPIFGNFSIANLQPRHIHIEWDLNVSASVIGFDIRVKPVEASNVHRLDRLGSDYSDMQDRRTVYELDGLDPETEYELVVYAISSDGVVGASDRIVFRTLSANDEVTVSKLNAHPIEFIIVISILVAWGVAFGIFVHKWGTIRIIQPRDYRSKHDPKNLHTIKVVSSATDSVIYRNFSKKFNSTMAAREKKIERMNTMPNIKIEKKEGDSGGDIRGPPQPALENSRFRDTFIQKDLNSAKATTSLAPRQKTPTSTFGTFQLGYRNTEKGLMGMPTSYIEQLRTTANIMLDLDKKAKKSEPQKTVISDSLTLASSLNNFPQGNEADKAEENEGMHMVTLLKVVEEDEEQSGGTGAAKNIYIQTQH